MIFCSGYKIFDDVFSDCREAMRLDYCLKSGKVLKYEKKSGI